MTADLPDPTTTGGWLRRCRAEARRAGLWRLVYEAGLVALVTVAAVVPSVLAGWYPLAPWLVGFSTPILMLARLRFPVAGYLAAALVGLATGGQNSLLLLVLSASLGYRAARWWHLTAALAAAGACYLLSFTLWESPLTVTWAVTMAGVFTMLAVVPAGIARLVRQRRTLLASLHRRNQQLHQQQAELARQAQSRERARIARDLHDSLGHRLTLISLYAGMLRTAEDGDRADGNRAEVADLVRQTSTTAMAELRQILGILGQSDPQPAVRPLTGLDDLAEPARASGAQVEIVREGQPRPLATLTEHAAYRVIQEGLTNALRHAHGGGIEVRLRYEPDALVAGVTNTAGRPTVSATSQQGLLGLTERVRIAGGMLYHGPTPDGGFRLAATLPYLRDEQPPAAAAQDPSDQPAEGDFAVLLNRASRRSRITLAVSAVSIISFLVLCAAGFWLLSLSAVDQDTYDAVYIGQPEAEVRALLPDDELARTDAAGGRPVADATCVDYEAAGLPRLEYAQIYRFCFRDGKLVDKQTFDEEQP